MTTEEMSDSDRTLRIYVAPHCDTCRESARLATVIADQHSAPNVELVNVEETKLAAEIFAVPTFVYRGRVLFLGNPAEDELCQRIMTVDRELGTGQSSTMVRKLRGRTGN